LAARAFAGASGRRSGAQAAGALGCAGGRRSRAARGSDEGANPASGSRRGSVTVAATGSVLPAPRLRRIRPRARHPTATKAPHLRDGGCHRPHRPPRVSTERPAAPDGRRGSMPAATAKRSRYSRQPPLRKPDPASFTAGGSHRAGFVAKARRNRHASCDAYRNAAAAGCGSG